MGKKKPENKALLQAEETGYGGLEDEEILDSEEVQDETSDPDYVVLKGNCVRHNGREYGENMRIPVTGADAERLIQAGVIADLQAIRKKALSRAVGVSITEG